MSKNLVYDIGDKPQPSKLIVFAIQQLLAIMAATIAVPAIVGNGMSASAALFGAGVGTLVYQLFTKFRSPVFLGSSFAFIGSMFAAFGGAASISAGYAGLIIGAIFAGLVYVVLALIVKYVGVKWINKLMPPVVIGPTVALIGLSLAGAAVKDVFSYGPQDGNGAFIMSPTLWVSFICAIVTMLVVIICSTYGKKMVKLIPFIIGILAGYALSVIFTLIGNAAGIDAMKRAMRKLQTKVDCCTEPISPDHRGRIAELGENLRYISPSNSPEASEIENEFIEVVSRIALRFEEYSLNQETIERELREAESIYKNRKNIYSN